MHVHSRRFRDGHERPGAGELHRPSALRRSLRVLGFHAIRPDSKHNLLLRSWVSTCTCTCIRHRFCQTHPADSEPTEHLPSFSSSTSFFRQDFWRGIDALRKEFHAQPDVDEDITRLSKGRSMVKAFAVNFEPPLGLSESNIPLARTSGESRLRTPRGVTHRRSKSSTNRGCAGRETG